MAYRNLTFRSLANDIRLETYFGEEHIVIPCIALVGDEVVYGMNADGPEFIPANELEMSTLGWGDRPVLYDHPPASTSSACEPRTLEAMSFGRTFFPRFEDKKLKLEAWCNKIRAKEIGQEELLASAERGDVIELSIGAIISLIRQNGVSPSGKRFGAYWTGIQSDHLAIGLSGSQGACNIEMGCGANRVLKANSDSGEVSDTRTMRANRGVDHMPEIRTTTAIIVDRKPRQFSEGISFESIRNWLTTALSKLEPGANWLYVEDIYESSVVYSVHFDNSPSKLYERSYTLNGEVVTVSSERIEVRRKAVEYEPVTVVQVEKEAKSPCGCQTVSTEKTVAANETDKSTDKEIEMAEDKDKKTPDATPPATATGTPAATPATANAPAQSTAEDSLKTAEAPATPASPGAPAITTEQLKALLEDHPVVKHYRAQEAREKSTLVAKLAAKQTVLSKEQLEAKPIEELRTYAEFLSVSVPAPAASGDFSGRMMADGTEDDVEIKPVPNVWEEARKLRAQRKAGAAS